MHLFIMASKSSSVAEVLMPYPANEALFFAHDANQVAHQIKPQRTIDLRQELTIS